MYPRLEHTLEEFITEFDRIPSVRKILLNQLTSFVQQKLDADAPVLLNFICTHNSRRSHIAQLWAHAAAHYWRLPNVRCFSGGTEATAFNPRAVKAMQEAGFDIKIATPGDNPVYEVRFAGDARPVSVFSKTYDDPVNPGADFAAVMTCSHADQNCPVVVGSAARISLTYDDPKDFDGTPQETAKYNERVREIGREILYAFSRVNSH
jgi:arsenate reductase (thioredoxin)